MAQEQLGEANLNEAQFVFRTLIKMSDAGAEKQIDKEFSYFTDAYMITMAYHDAETRLALENDLRTFYKLVKEAETKYPNESEREKYIKKLKQDMVQTHKYFCYSALPNMQLQSVEKEAEVDFGQISIEDLERLVRTNSGLKTSIEATE